MTSDLNRLRLVIEPKPDRNDVWRAVGPHSGEPTHALGAKVVDLPLSEMTQVLSLANCWHTHRHDAGRVVQEVILPKDRDPRFVTIRRGGTLSDSDHHLLALWAAACAEHVLHLFESVQPDDRRPRQAIEQARAWVRGDATMTQARTAAGHANGAARDLRGAPRHAAYAAAQAAAVAHVAAHELGAAAYAIKAVRAAAPKDEADNEGRVECRWQRDQLPDAIRELVLDDQRLRNDICWSVFDL